MTSKKDERQQHNQQLRGTAEAKLSSPLQNIERTMKADSETFLHEVRVHQVELEMQNEELRQAQLALEASRAHYQELFDFAPVGYLTLNAEGMIVEINLTGARLLGIDPKRLINKYFAQFIGDPYKDRWYRHFMQARQAVGKLACELPFCHKDGTRLYLRLNCLHIGMNGSPPLLRITLTDITELKRAEKALRLAAVAFETQEGIFITDETKAVLQVNQAFSRITGYSAAEVVGKLPAILRPGDNTEDFLQDLSASVQRDRYWQGEIWDKRKNGEAFPMWLTITAVADEQGNITHYVGSITDITQRKQAEKVLLDARERLQKQVATTQEELEKIKEETEGVNTAFNILVKRESANQSDARLALSKEIKQTILPFLTKLKGASIGRRQSSQLASIIETNLQNMIANYGHSNQLSVVLQSLTPTEARVASLVRQGLPTKLIASTLNISPETVNLHRKRIRKKLVLDNKTKNLQTYLRSLAERPCEAMHNGY